MVRVAGVLVAAVLLAPAGAAPAAPRHLVAFTHGGDIWVVGTDGKGARNLTRTPGATEADPSWSPDASQLAYMRGTAVWEMNVDGTNQHQVVPGVSPGFQDATAAGVAWSSKNQIAYMTYDNTRNLGDIMVASADGSSAHMLGLDPNLPSEHRSPGYDDLTWTPDGNRLYFGLDNIEAQSGIFSVAADGTDWQHLYATVGGYVPSGFSPNGTQLVYTRPHGGAGPSYNFDLRLTKASGAQPRWLTQYAGDDLGGSWSPNGRDVVFSSQRGVKPLHVNSSPFDLYVIDVQTRHVFRLLHLVGNEFDPQWQPG